jgi:hypothetical protein
LRQSSAIGVLLVVTDKELAAIGERVVLEDANGGLEGGPLSLLVRAESRLVGPSGELAVRGELQREDLVAGETRRRLVAHGAGVSSNSMSRS